MKIVGHRGASGYAPENTLLSFQTAIDCGCDKVEMDVRVTSDGQAVVIHDKTLTRTTNGKGAVSARTLEQLKKLECAQGQKIPTLREAVDLCRNRIALILELKEAGASGAVVRILADDSLRDSTLVISFDGGLIREVKGIDPGIRVGLLFSKSLYKRNLDLLWRLAEEISLDYICPRSDALSSRMVSGAHTRGLGVYAYGVNNREVFQKMVEYGVDEIGTDFPRLFKG
jgi:glycerophosphoryl diester phosphodiesterase